MAGNTLTLAIDAGGTYFKSGLVTSEGYILEGSRISFPVDSAGDGETIKRAYQTLVEVQLKKAEEAGASVTSIGVDTPGPFDYQAGESRMLHKFKSIYGVPLRPWIAEAAGDLPIHFLHDSTAFLLGECWRGEGQGFDSLAGVMLGTGLGFAYKQKGIIQLNSQGGPGCSLYNRPFLTSTAEEYVSRRGIRNRYFARVPDAPPQIDVAQIAQLAQRGDLPAQETFEETGQMLGEILLPVLQDIKPEALILGGQISKAYPLFGTALHRQLQQLKLKKLSPSRCPDTAHLLGCAAKQPT
ncbi:MAG: ROK family protein [Angelakisella sp.]|nr:ROK family protein [Angelakisella sp.]